MGSFYWLAGVEYVFLLILISIAFAILPLVGISYLTLFLAFIFVLQGEYRSAAIVLFGFYGVVNWIDVLLRPRLISKEAYTNFALILLGILGGYDLGWIYWVVHWTNCIDAAGDHDPDLPGAVCR